MRLISAPLLMVSMLAACNISQPSSEFEAVDPAELSAPEAQVDSTPPEEAAAEAAAWVAGPDDGRVLAGLTAPQIGRFTWPGMEPGRGAANAACRDLGADHLCTDAEIDEARDRGELAALPDGASFYVPHGVTVHEQDGKQVSLGDCMGLTYPTGDKAWGNFAIKDRTGVHFSVADARNFDTACLTDVAACAAYVPTGMGCNIARSQACCY